MGFEGNGREGKEKKRRERRGKGGGSSYGWWERGKEGVRWLRREIEGGDKGHEKKLREKREEKGEGKEGKKKGEKSEKVTAVGGKREEGVVGCVKGKDDMKEWLYECGRDGGDKWWIC